MPKEELPYEKKPTAGWDVKYRKQRPTVSVFLCISVLMLQAFHPARSLFFADYKTERIIC